MECWESLPEKFIDRVREIVTPEKQTGVLESFCRTKPVAIRVNTIRISAAELEKFFIAKNISPDRVAWYQDAFIVGQTEKTELMNMDIYKNGFLYFQNLSSMIPALILHPQPDEKILDIAAAPGSKVTQIAQLMNNTGEIVANDISKKRLYKLRTITAQLGVANVKITQIPGEYIWRKYPNYFDKVLIDAPCSMEGRFHANDQSSYKDWSMKKIKVLSYLQKRLIRSAFYSVKQGGVIVYVTCTLSPEENEEVIDWLLTEEKEHVKVVEINSNFPNDGSLKKWKNKIFQDEIGKTVRILPSNTMEGFFVAKLKRVS